MDFTAEQIAQLINGEIIGDPQRAVNNFANIDVAEKNDLTFLGNPKYIGFLKDSKAGVVIISKQFEFKKAEDKTFIVVSDAYEAITSLLTYYSQLINAKSGRENPIFISDSATIGEGEYIGAFAYIGENVKLGNNVKVYPHVYIGDNVEVGDDTVINTGVKIYNDCKIGKNCIIHASSVIGSDGFGFNPNEKGEFIKVPQIGNVIIEDDVEIGACCTIDRGTMGATIIRKGTKLDNQIQVAHNVEIGEHNVIAAQTGIAGSTKIGKYNMIGGQVGVAGHLTIGDKNQIQAQSGINKNVKNGEQLYGSPAIDAMNYRKSYIHFKRLNELVKKIDEIQKNKS
ncbi:UDP-3-O-(3-hydroxymyristoyl)glucosamine N-acyltransferase [Weeksellaceae bacterium TAE3-ERU29]|nr:UDP-3-O-(3-hydroxymyristoyl)glucosamine N-acyltransferase [Weeksellaceae bacterium TAE3-ERU29]